MTRHGSVIGLSEQGKADYLRLHAAVWPGVLAKISDCNIRNYSIFLKEPENLLFSFFEYHGADFAGDMARMAADPVTQEWWALNKPLQQPLDTRKDGEWWAEMTEIFHHD
ncbi:L-rhamnose mutarotase [Paracoccus sp. CPCC 101403]|uniref:L-rhamnose mutarotase n=2 Tax=Paracoccus broussonetiae TaxID=3075834 RepID=A0ABU3EAV2_9RHOB|nr:L-rhamnose mutarotase [Paracoccus sp. CPCC 101403]MDT1060997.1 L-rhamnose mutarotase [Paracoccus sp. CPCC 101403]